MTIVAYHAPIYYGNCGFFREALNQQLGLSQPGGSQGEKAVWALESGAKMSISTVVRGPAAIWGREGWRGSSVLGCGSRAGGQDLGKSDPVPMGLLTPGSWLRGFFPESQGSSPRGTQLPACLWRCSALALHLLLPCPCCGEGGSLLFPLEVGLSFGLEVVGGRLGGSGGSWQGPGRGFG